MAISKIQKNYIVKTKQASGAININPGAYGATTIDISESGYKALGVIGYTKSGSSGGYCAPTIMSFNSSRTSLTFGMVNTSSSSTASPLVYVDILYEKQ